jgi:hypothetical protein
MELYLHSHNTPSRRDAHLKRSTGTLPLPLPHDGIEQTSETSRVLLLAARNLVAIPTELARLLIYNSVNV